MKNKDRFLQLCRDMDRAYQRDKQFHVRNAERMQDFNWDSDPKLYREYREIRNELNKQDKLFKKEFGDSSPYLLGGSHATDTWDFSDPELLFRIFARQT